MHDVAKPETMKGTVKKSSRKIVVWAIFAVVGVFIVLVLIKGLQIVTMASAGNGRETSKPYGTCATAPAWN